MALFSYSIGTHPFVDQKPSDFTRVDNQQQMWYFLGKRCSIIIKREVECDGKIELYKNKKWKRVPRYGDMIFSSEEVIVKDDSDEFYPVKDLSIPIPIHDHFGTFVPEETKEVEYVVLRSDDLNILKGWMGQVTGSIKDKK